MNGPHPNAWRPRCHPPGPGQQNFGGVTGEGAARVRGNLIRSRLLPIAPMSTSTGPLTDLTVLDLSTIVSGGTVTSLLADLGAQVIKVEHPKGGDPLRSWASFVGGQSIWWKVVSRN